MASKRANTAGNQVSEVVSVESLNDKPKRTRNVRVFLTDETRAIVQQFADENIVEPRVQIDLMIAFWHTRGNIPQSLAHDIEDSPLTFEMLGIEKTRKPRAYKAQVQTLQDENAELRRQLEALQNANK